MNNIKKYWPLAIIIGLIIITGSIFYAKSQNELAKAILFYSTSCPHCQNVAEYIQANNIKAKYSFEELEVSGNKANAALLGQKAQFCKMDLSQGIGVPFFFNGQKCLMGDQDIINYFKNN